MRVCPRCRVAHRETAHTCGTCGLSLVAPVRRWGTPPPRSTEQDAPGTTGLLVEPRLWQTTASQIGKRRAAKPGGLDQHFLVPPFGERIRLDLLGSVLTIGREDCEVRIDSPTVSRRHAEISLRGSPPRAFLKDLGTTNGTRLNGQPLTGERALADRDVIRVGEVTAVYRLLPAEAAAKILDTPPPGPQALDATIPIHAGITKPRSPIVGDVAFFPMADLLGRLTVVRASGAFTVAVDGTHGSATFRDGAIEGATFAGQSGNPAVQAIAALRRGTFRFEPEE